MLCGLYEEYEEKESLLVSFYLRLGAQNTVIQFMIFMLHLIFFSIRERLDLKMRLGCKPFSWYVKNVYPELK